MRRSSVPSEALAELSKIWLVQLFQWQQAFLLHEFEHVSNDATMTSYRIQIERATQKRYVVEWEMVLFRHRLKR